MAHLLVWLHSCHDRGNDGSFSSVERSFLGHKHIVIGVEHFRVRENIDGRLLDLFLFTYDRVKLLETLLLQCDGVIFEGLLIVHALLMLLDSHLERCRIVNWTILALFFHRTEQISIATLVQIL